MTYIEDRRQVAAIANDFKITIFGMKNKSADYIIETNKKGVMPRGGLCYVKDKKLLIAGFEDGTM